MFWSEEQSEENTTSSSVWDLAFSIQCRKLPVDHLYSLSQALQYRYPDLLRDGIGLHEIHIAGSQNGWQRPDASQGQYLIPSRRTRMQLRVSAEHSQKLQDQLQQVTLDIEGIPLLIGSARKKPLQAHSTLYARHLALEENEINDENRFLQRIANTLQMMDIEVRKALCGKQRQIKTAQASPLFTRSLMLADLTPPESLRLLEQGLGERQHMGCGLFLPMKGIQHLDQEMTH